LSKAPALWLKSAEFNRFQPPQRRAGIGRTFSGALATMTAASSDKNPSGVHFPVHKRFFGAARWGSLYFLADGAKEESEHLERFENSTKVRVQAKKPLRMAWRRK
jgi:hypothetical protein